MTHRPTDGPKVLRFTSRWCCRHPGARVSLRASRRGRRRCRARPAPRERTERAASRRKEVVAHRTRTRVLLPNPNEALGRTEPYLFESDESMLRGALASGHPWLDGITYERLWEEGYARLNCPEDWRPFANGGFATRSGKAELYSEPLREAGHDPLPSPGDIATGRGLQLITGKQLHFPVLTRT